MQHRTFGEPPAGAAAAGASQHFSFGGAVPPPEPAPAATAAETETHVSPLAVFSERAVAEHRVAQAQLAAVLLACDRRAAALSERERAEVAEHEAAAAGLAAEEGFLLRRLRESDGAADAARRAMDDFRAASTRDAADAEEEAAALDGEMEEVIGLEGKLEQMREDVAGRLDSVAAKRCDFARDMDRGMSQLESVRQQALVTSGEATLRFGADEAAALSAVRSSTPCGPRSLPAGAGAAAAASHRSNAEDRFGYPPPEPPGGGRRLTSPTRPPHHRERRAEADIVAEAALGGCAAGGVDVSGVQALPSALKGRGSAASCGGGGGGGGGGSSLSSVGLRFVEDAVRRRSVQFSPRQDSSSPRRSTGHAAAAAAAPYQRPSALSPLGRGDEYRAADDDLSAAGGGRSLHTMCSAGQVEAAIESLRRRPSLADTVDSQGNTPLHCACAASDPSLELTNVLLASGASVTALNADGLSPFHLAALNTADNAGHTLKKYLVFKAGVNPNQRTSRGETAAHLCAAHDRHVDSLKWLTTAGVDISIVALTDRQDQVSSPMRVTALDKATQNGTVSQRSREVLALAAAAPPG